MRANLRIVDSPEALYEAAEPLVLVEPRTERDAPPADLHVPSSAGEFLEASVAQDGGAEGMPVRRGSQHQYRAVLHEAIVRVADAIDTHGVCDKQGRLRRSWISSLQGLIHEARTIDEMLGLERDTQSARRPQRSAAVHQSRPAPATALEREEVTPRPPRLPSDIEDFLDRMDFGA